MMIIIEVSKRKSTSVLTEMFLTFLLPSETWLFAQWVELDFFSLYPFLNIIKHLKCWTQN